MRGTIYGPDGQVSTSARSVRAVSLQESVPYDAAIDVREGRYVLHNLPVGCPIELTVEGNDGARRVRVRTFRPEEANGWCSLESFSVVVNFGGPETREDREAPAYFLPTADATPSAEPTSAP